MPQSVRCTLADSADRTADFRAEREFSGRSARLVRQRQQLMQLVASDCWRRCEQLLASRLGWGMEGGGAKSPALFPPSHTEQASVDYSARPV